MQNQKLAILVFDACCAIVHKSCCEQQIRTKFKHTINKGLGNDGAEAKLNWWFLAKGTVENVVWYFFSGHHVYTYSTINGYNVSSLSQLRMAYQSE